MRKYLIGAAALAAILTAGHIADAEPPAVFAAAGESYASAEFHGDLEPVFDSSRRMMSLAAEPLDGKKHFCSAILPLRPTGIRDILTAECELVIGGKTPQGRDAVSCRFRFEFCDVTERKAAGFTLRSERGHRNRAVSFPEYDREVRRDCGFLTDRPLLLKLTFDRGKSLWHGEIVMDEITIFRSGEQRLAGAVFVPSRLRIVAESADCDDGMSFQIKMPKVIGQNPRSSLR